MNLLMPLEFEPPTFRVESQARYWKLMDILMTSTMHVQEERPNDKVMVVYEV